jgi:outer membrane receptor protein involved in Fe transport
MRHYRMALLGASALAIVILAAGPAAAQSKEQAPRASSSADQPAAEPDEITVTGTRLSITGFTAPTATQVLSAEQLQSRAVSNVADFLNEVPGFRPTQTPQTNTQNARNGGLNFADLRALGSIRTLTMVNGRRFVPSASTGQVDLNLIPTGLIGRIDVVTGGASAAYGSDAVAGVVNIILDDKLRGFKGDVSYGISERGDAAEKRISLAFGTSFADGRGHIVAGGEYVKSDGIGSFFDRDWGAAQPELVSYPAGTRPAGAPSRFYATGASVLTYAFGGLILGNNADTNAANGVDVLRGIQFGPGGAVQSFNYGTAIGNNAINFTGGNLGLFSRTGHQLVVPVNRKSFLISGDYEVSDKLTFFFEGNYGRSVANMFSPPVRDTTATGAVIKRDNAFLPSAIATIMDANAITSFGLGRQYDDFGPVLATSSNKTERVLFGVKGSLGSDWKYDAYYAYGQNEYELIYRGLRIEQNFRNALDSIIVGGQAVCRDAVARAAGCVALNPFGVGSPSAGAIAYATGTSIHNLETQQQLAALNIQGKPFSTWAGPVAVAFGAEYRKDKAAAISDAISTASGFNYGNPKPYAGAITVKEFYGEVTVPLAHDTTLLHSLNLNGAVRYTDYSTTGGVTTWKLGATWEPVEGLLIRGTRSRDIRAPNLSDFFATTTSRATLTNPFSGLSGQFVVVNAPSPTLVPEKADTTTVGVVLSPRSIPGLNIAIDYYNIKIDGAISTYAPQQLMDGCASEVAAGKAAFNCSFLTMSGTGTSTSISEIRTQLLNIASIKTSGVDFTVSYRFDLGHGRLTARLNGNYTAHLIANDGRGQARTYNAAGLITSVGSVIDRAGQLGGFSGGVNVDATTVPRWSLNGQLNYEIGELALNFGARWFPSGLLDSTLVGPGGKDYDPASPISIGNNRVAGATYLNLGASYNVINDGHRKVQFYFQVNNLTDRSPSFPATAVAGLYDRIGRFYKIGLRTNF